MLIAEYAIEGYDMYRSDGANEHGGVILYTRDNLLCTPCYELNNSGFNDCIWCTVSTGGNETVLIGVIYRSPSSTSDNNENLFKKTEQAISLPEYIMASNLLN